MAAIAGIIGDKVSPEQIGSMLNVLRHRGPDHSTIRDLPYGAIGCATFDTAYPTPAAFSGEREPYILLDGDIYNPRAGEISDAALVRELYLEHGKSCFERLDGAYSCAIIRRDEVILIRDHIGARPLIYGTQGDRMLFASEAKALAKHVSAVQELEPGHYYSSKEGLQTFAGHTPAVPEAQSPEETAKVLRELIVEAVRKRMADGTVEGVALSGGLDSSIIAAVAKEFNSKLKLFSSTIERYPGKDIGNAKLMAQYLGLDHHIYRITDRDMARIIPQAIWYLESFDEDCISGFIANYYTSRLISRFANCILVGEGADELFGGYFRELEEVTDPDQKEAVARRLVDIAYNTALRRLDRGWLANSVNYRAPYLDSAVVRFSQKIPMRLKIKAGSGQQRGVEKWILREAFRDILPPEIANRPKLRFARGVGVDELMDEITMDKVSEEELAQTTKTSQGMTFSSPKELYYYRLFKRCFPPAYEDLVTRWDPFKS
ncbi:MAG: asparagine synthase-related protein [Candidatus Bipolaricaulota bacterium]|nr:asparagine synthase-related protein [Candidatus Bipolaricaulota bacterium]